MKEGEREARGEEGVGNRGLQRFRNCDLPTVCWGELGGLISISLLRQENWKATGKAFWMNRK